MRYIGTTKDLCKFIEDAESKIQLEDVGVTLEYGPVLLFHKIAAMIGLQKAIAERCKESGVIPEIIEVMSAYKAFKPLSKRKMAEDYPPYCFSSAFRLASRAFLSSGDVQSDRRNKTL